MPVTYTNKHNLPEEFVNAVLVDEHVSIGNISVTQLIDSPQIRQLKKLHSYEVDVMDMIAMVLGTGMHTVLERGSMKGTYDSRVLQRAVGILIDLEEDKAAQYIKKLITEKLGDFVDDDLMTEQIQTLEVLGWTISGTPDKYRISLKKLSDYKNTGATAFMFPEQKKMWNAQMNIYAKMLRVAGFDVDLAEVIAVLKDFSKMKILSNKDYPKTPVVMIDVKLIDDDTLMKYIEGRVRLHQRADAGESIPCTPKDRWAKPDIWAVKLTGGKRSLRNALSEREADSFIEKNGFKHKKPLQKEYRPSESFRCANGYCAVADVCPQYQKEKELAAEKAEKT